MAPQGFRTPDPDRIIDRLRGPGPTAVALSGGVDSSVVAALLVRAIGEAARAVTFSGPAVAEPEVERARSVARAIGIAHDVVRVDPLGSAEYRANPSNRCYFCRQVESSALRRWGEANGVTRFVDGVHADDLAGVRPGIRAMDEAGFRHPLAEAGWGKAEVREYARTIRLPNAEQPSDACLASRVRHGQTISAELLARIARAEALVRELGFRRVRVRVEGRSARIEVDRDETARLLEEPIGSQVRAEVAGVGFEAVSLDPNGYRGGPGA